MSVFVVDNLDRLVLICRITFHLYCLQWHGVSQWYICRLRMILLQLGYLKHIVDSLQIYDPDYVYLGNLSTCIGSFHFDEVSSFLSNVEPLPEYNHNLVVSWVIL